MFHNGWGSFNNEDTFTFSPGSLHWNWNRFNNFYGSLWCQHHTVGGSGGTEQRDFLPPTIQHLVLWIVSHREADVLRPKKLSGANHLTHGDRELIMQRNWNNLCKNSVNFEGLWRTERHQSCSSTSSSLTFEIGWKFFLCCCAAISLLGCLFWK